VRDLDRRLPRRTVGRETIEKGIRLPLLRLHRYTTDEATIQMNTTPTDPAVAATVFQSLWDNNLFAVRATRWVAWLRAQSGAVSYMTEEY
jgi:hypothetical protein